MTRVQKNWDWIESQYKTGLPVRRIATLYADRFPGERCSHQSINQYAARHHWNRDELSSEVRAVTRRKVMEQTAREHKDKGQDVGGKGKARPAELKPDDGYDSEVIEINSELATAIEMKHRALGSDTLSVCREILCEIAANVAEEVAGNSDGNDKPALRSMSPAARSKALKDLTIAMDKAVNIERKSWDMDTKEGAGGKGTVFNVLINVPDPKPLPDDF